VAALKHPAAAAIGTRINGVFGRGQEMATKFGTSAVNQMSSIALGAVSIGKALELVNTHLERKKQLLEDARLAQLGLAPAQQRAILNLTGVDAETKRRMLEVEIPKIGKEAGFSDLGKLSDALGAAYSSSGDLSAAREAVSAAAALQTQNTDAVTATAAAALDVSRASGLSDPKKNLSLILQAGSYSRVAEPRHLMETIAPAAASAASTVPMQDRLTATQEAMALYGAFTKAANDTGGSSSGKGVIDLSIKMSSLFRDIPAEIAKSKAEIEKTQEKIRKSGLSKKETIERATLEAALDPEQLAAAGKERSELLDVKDKLRPGEKLTGDQVRKLRYLDSLIDFSKNLDRAKSEERLAELNTKSEGTAITRYELLKLESLDRFVKDAVDLGDTSGLGQRIRLITERQGLREKLFETEFGEAQLKQAYQSMFDAESLVRRDYEAGREGITGDVKTYHDQADDARRGTSQLKLADVSERVKTRVNAFKVAQIEEAIRAEAQLALDSVLPETQADGFSGFMESLGEMYQNTERKIFGGGKTAEDEVDRSIGIIEDRLRVKEFRKFLREAEGVELTEAEKQQIELLAEVRDELLTLREVARNTRQNPYRDAAKASKQATESYGQ
jgi:hypothetical protein